MTYGCKLTDISQLAKKTTKKGGNNEDKNSNKKIRKRK